MMNKKGISVDKDTLVILTLVVIALVVIIIGFGKYIYPVFKNALPKIFG